MLTEQCKTAMSDLLEWAAESPHRRMAVLEITRDTSSCKLIDLDRPNTRRGFTAIAAGSSPDDAIRKALEVAR